MKKAETYLLFRIQTMLMLETSRKGQLGANLQPVQKPVHLLVSNKQGRPARC